MLTQYFSRDRPSTWKRGIFAHSPYLFRGCGDVLRGFATQRILFEMTSRGLLVLMHESYDRKSLERLLNLGFDSNAKTADLHVGLTIPLSCYRESNQRDQNGRRIPEAIYLSLAPDDGKWRRVGVRKECNPNTSIDLGGGHSFAYSNEYVRIYVHQHHTLPDAGEGPTRLPTEWLHIRDSWSRAGRTL